MYPSSLPHIPELLQSHTEWFCLLVQRTSLGLQDDYTAFSLLVGTGQTHSQVPGTNDFIVNTLQTNSVVTPPNLRSARQLHDVIDQVARPHSIGQLVLHQLLVNRTEGDMRLCREQHIHHPRECPPSALPQSVLGRQAHGRRKQSCLGLIRTPLLCP